jgi:murein DD-endopeptidase MepM/ murein hydrolase activator NlpD
MARKSKGRWKSIFFLVAIALLGFAFTAAFRAGGSPSITIEPGLPAIGARTPFDIVVAEGGRGLSAVQVDFVQGDRVELLDRQEFTPREPWQFWGERTPSTELLVEVGRETLEGLKEGTGTIRVTAERAPSLLRHPAPVVEDLEIPVKLRPPQLQVRSSNTFVSQGGCEVVIYEVTEDSVRDGVQSGEAWFPGYPLPGGEPNERFALFAAPFDLEEGEDQIQLVAVDQVGNASRQSFVDKFFAKPFKTDTIRLNERFMARVVPAILSQTPELRDEGDLLANYLQINNRLRASNAQELTDLSATSSPEFMWTRKFIPMKNAKVMSDFADRRSYVFEGNVVDRQDHLGFDLASTRRAEVQVANDGVVLLARYFGIYGNAVVVDHGFGLLSLYGHLSEIAVAEGDRMERGQSVGRSGQTGLAGGDHLHFTMLLQGHAVNPREWWDAHWIHDRLKLKLGDALAFQD